MESVDQLILTTWKEIALACGVRTRRTIQKKAKKYHMPYAVMNGRPEISKMLLLEWHRKICEIEERKRKEKNFV